MMINETSYYHEELFSYKNVKSNKTAFYAEEGDCAKVKSQCKGINIPRIFVIVAILYSTSNENIVNLRML